MFSKLKVGPKLLLVVLLLLLPLGFTVYNYVKEKNASIDFSQKELLGGEYLPPVRQLLEQATLRQLTQDAQYDARLDAALADVEKVDKRLAADLDSTKTLEALKAALAAARGASPETRPEADGRVVSATIDLVRKVGDTSNLILDPDLDTYYLMDSVIVQVPEVFQRVGNAGARAAAYARTKAEADRAQLEAIAGGARANLDAIARGMRVATDYHRETNKSEALQGVLTAANEAVKVTSDVLGKLEADPRGEGIKGVAAASKLYDVQLAKLDELLKVRIAGFTRSRLVSLATALLGLLVAGLVAFSIVRGITSQVDAIDEVMGQIAAGSYKARVTVTSEDELGRMARGLNSMLDNTVSLVSSRDERDQIQASIRRLLNDVSGVADGDLTHEAEVTADMTGAIADSFNLMIDELRRLIGDVQDTTLHVSSSANEVQATTEHLADSSQQQSMQIVDTSAAIDEMATSIRQVSDNAGTSATVAEQARANALKGADAVGKTIKGMDAIREKVQETAKRLKRLGESSQEVGEIVDLIGDIADRTSILALNASIQAAMAGEAGRGFAVVAEEVERLAERSTEATKRIGTLIKTIQSETNEAVASMEGTINEVVGGSNVATDAGRALEEIRGVTERLSELIQSISLASKQQARGSEALAKAMGDISETTQQTAAGTKQAAVSIRNLATLADNLRGSVSRFKLPKKG